MKNILSGYADEAGADLATQIRATRAIGWSHIEMRNVTVPGFEGGNLHDIPDEAFLRVVEAIGEAGLRIHCFGSAIANGGKNIEKPIGPCLDAARRAARRMPKLGCKFIRIMSYPIVPGENADQYVEERFRRLREIQKIFADIGVTVVHENCANYGGMGWSHTLHLLENVPGLKLVFDMGNCVFDFDYTKPAPRPRQSAWDFYNHVREHIAHVHIKDGILGPQGEHIHVFPGEGAGDVKCIVTDLLSTGYTGAFSIEPHMGTAPQYKENPSQDEGRYLTYVEYGRRFNALIGI